jgi:MoaA/NifB/PqqE/SkfB family radical SAM enzyme
MRLLSAPLDVQFDITRKCQLDCSYCCATPLDGYHADTSLALTLLKELGELGVISLLLSGGEATLHPSFLKILEQAARCIEMISFGTNGIRLSRGDLCSSIRDVAPNVLITISLDSLDPYIHNLNRGHGGDLALKAIENCCAYGLSVSISCVLTEHNVDSADRIVNQFYPAVKKFSFFPRVPRSSSERFSDYSLFSGKVSALAKRLVNRKRELSGLDLMLPYAPLASACVGSAFSDGSECSCFVTKSYITSDFGIFPCYYGASPENLYGHYGISSTFKSVWDSEKAATVRARAAQVSLCGTSFVEDLVPTRFRSKIYGLAPGEVST